MAVAARCVIAPLCTPRVSSVMKMALAYARRALEGRNALSVSLDISICNHLVSDYLPLKVTW